MLGRAALGLAVVTAAVGALIDQANGGRLHPEQWLGAAAAVCGAGMLIGVVWGRARWLILPAAALAAAGYVGGAAAERGIALQDRGDRYLYVSGGYVDQDASVSIGDVDLSIYEVPLTTRFPSINVLVGDVRVTTNTTVELSTELHWNVEHGSVTIDGVRQPDVGSARLGPGGPADVVVDVKIWRGDLTVWNQELFTGEGSTYPAPTTIVTGDPMTTVTTIVSNPVEVNPVFIVDGVSATSDGFFLLANGEAMINNLDQVVLGFSSLRGDGVTEIETSFGVFQLLPRSILLTPMNQIVDLQAWRGQLAPAVTATTIAPVATVASATTVDPTATSTTTGVNATTTTAAVQQDQSSSTTTAPTTTLAGG